MAVLVYTENWDGKFKKITREICTYASQVAEKLNTEAVAVSIGKVDDEELKSLGDWGISSVYKMEDERLIQLENKAYTRVILDVISRVNPQFIVFAHNFTGKALAPRVSAKIKAGLVTGAVDVPLSFSPFVIRKKCFTGKAFAHVEVKTEKAIITLAPNSIEIKENKKPIEIIPLKSELKDEDFQSRVVDTKKVSGKVLLTDAEIVVSGGRGMKGPENWGPIEELADLLGGATACSRPVSDEGWRPHEEHTGQTGKIIAPNLYIACGISGAIQHVAGVSSSKCIVAINKDEEAPIFEVADYGIVGDALKVLPALIEAVKEWKSQG